MITRNFSRDEFICGCGCGLAEPHPMLVVGLQWVRNILNLPVAITSGSRCPAWNKLAGGADNSFHMTRDSFDGYSMAADIVVPGLPLVKVYEALPAVEVFGPLGVGVYVDSEPRVHIDVRGVTGVHPQARWAQVDGKPAVLERALEVDLKRRAA